MEEREVAFSQDGGRGSGHPVVQDCQQEVCTKCGGSQRSLGLWEDFTEAVALEGGCKEQEAGGRAYS